MKRSTSRGADSMRNGGQPMHTKEHIFRWQESWPWALVDWHQVARRVHAHPYPPTLLPHFGGDTTHHSVQRSAGKGAGLQRSGVCDQDGVAAGNDPASEYRVMVCDHAAPHREPIVSGQVVALFIRHRLSTRRPRPVNMSCSRQAGPLSIYDISCTAAACVAAPVPRKCACGLAVVGLHQKTITDSPALKKATVPAHRHARQARRNYLLQVGPKGMPGWEATSVRR